MRNTQTNVFYIKILAFFTEQATVDQVESLHQRTALHMACLRDQVEIADILLSHHQNQDTTGTTFLPDIFGYLPVHFCRSERMVELLSGVCYSTFSLQFWEHSLLIIILKHFFPNERLPNDYQGMVKTKVTALSIG